MLYIRTIKHKDMENITQYFSKHRKIWVDFTDNFGNKRVPNEQEIKEMRKYKYELR